MLKHMLTFEHQYANLLSVPCICHRWSIFKLNTSLFFFLFFWMGTYKVSCFVSMELVGWLLVGLFFLILFFSLIVNAFYFKEVTKVITLWLLFKGMKFEAHFCTYVSVLTHSFPGLLPWLRHWEIPVSLSSQLFDLPRYRIPKDAIILGWTDFKRWLAKRPARYNATWCYKV